MITYAQAEFLLDHYHSIIARAKNAAIELQKVIAYKLQHEKGNLIEELSLRAYDLAKVIVQSNKLSDVTAWVALNYDKMSLILWGEAERQIMDEVHVYGNIAEKVKNALKGLKAVELKVVELYYFDGLPVSKIAPKVGYSKPHCKRLRQEAVAKLQRLIELDEKEKEYLVKLWQEGTR